MINEKVKVALLSLTATTKCDWYASSYRNTKFNGSSLTFVARNVLVSAVAVKQISVSESNSWDFSTTTSINTICGNTDFNLGTGLFEGFLENEMLSYCDTAYLV